MELSQEAKVFLEGELKNVGKTLLPEEIKSLMPFLTVIEIKKTPYKWITIHMRFPKNYPKNPIYLEVKSKVLHCDLIKFLEKRVMKVLKATLKKEKGNFAQILFIVSTLRGFIENNKMLPCWKEMKKIKKYVPGFKENVKIYEKSGKVLVKFKEKNFFMNLKFIIPDGYPAEKLSIKVTKSNFLPRLLDILMIHVANLCANYTEGIEIETGKIYKLEKKIQTKRNYKMGVYVENKDERYAKMFLGKKAKIVKKDEPIPCLYKLIRYISEEFIKILPHLECAISKRKLLKDDPEKQIDKPKNDKNRIERMLCGHYVFFGELVKFISHPPFDKPKLCYQCGQEVIHHSVERNMRSLGKKWAQKEARKREIDEVVDFLDL